MRGQAIPFLMLQGFLYGSTLIASRFGVGQFAPTTYIWLRLALSSLGFLAVYALGRRRYTWPTDRRLWRHAMVIGIFGTALPMTALVSALQYQSSGVTAILITIGPVITALMAHFLLPDERLNRYKLLGAALALAGALFLTLRGETGLAEVSQANPVGYGLVFFAMLVASISMIYIRMNLRDEKPFDVAAIRMFTATVTLVPLSLLTVGFDLSRVSVTGVYSVLFAALAGTFLATIFDFYLINRFGATISAMVAYLLPVFASLGGWLLLGETITIGMLAGMGLILLGVGILNMRGPEPLPVIGGP
jgi:drug/metabolite transporter (DMT)-like permease